jgi:hypothetical protein
LNDSLFSNEIEMSAVPPQGSEERTSILPNMVPSGIGFFGSPYKPADAMPTPSQIGVRAGNSISDVVGAIKGVGYYIDQIGFGAPSTGLTNGMDLKPLGVNYFANTGTKCSNGAEMWSYIQGIPEGNALGDRVKQAMADMGMPPLKGLAPGMLEDVEHGLNPAPLMNSLLGSGYPQCKQVTLQVGDLEGNIQDPTTGEVWIADPETAKKGDGNLYYQTRWVQDTDKYGKPISLSRDEWVSVPKTYNPDGTPMKEGFENALTHPITLVSVGVLCLLAMSFVRR